MRVEPFPASSNLTAVPRNTYVSVPVETRIRSAIPPIIRPDGEGLPFHSPLVFAPCGEVLIGLA